jgi:hypothetical protein
VSQPILNTKLLEKFLRLAADELTGEWVLVGGTLLPAVGIDVRTTVDIDLLGLGKAEAAQQIELMTISESLGLPVETVNQAASFFLKKVGYSKKDLIILERGKSAVIYRPSAELYLRLKVGRLSETDLLDCELYLEFCVGCGDSVDREAMTSFLTEAVGKEKSSEKRVRLQALLKGLQKLAE